MMRVIGRELAATDIIRRTQIQPMRCASINIIV
jgi:hypothetical protein